MYFKPKVKRKRKIFLSVSTTRLYIKLANRNANQKYKYNQRRQNTISKGETTLRNICRDLFKNYKINYNNRYILGGLELDIYIPELRIGIEYNGTQHYRYTKKFHNNFNDFKKQKEKDYFKKILCQQKGIHFLIIQNSNEKKMREEIKKFLITIKDIGSNEVGLPMRQEGGKGLSEKIPEPLAQA